MDPLTCAALISTAGSLASSGLNFASGNYSLNKQIQASKNMAKWQATKLPALQREGYENAGYNPLLMFGAQPVHPEIFSAQGQNVDFSGAFGKVAEAMTGKEQAKNQKMYNDAVIDNAKAEIDNKKAQTDILKAQAEETRLNNAETRRITEDRNNMNHVVDLLKQRIDYIRSGAGTTRTSISFPGFFNRSETRDNFDSKGVIKALDMMIQKYGGGAYDSLDRDIQFDTLLGAPSAIERDVAKFNRDRNDRIRDEVQLKLDPRNNQLDDYYKKQKQELKKRKQENKRKDYRLPDPPPRQSFHDYTHLYEIPGMSLVR